MKYYFWDTSGLFGFYRKEQQNDEMGNLKYGALDESTKGMPTMGHKNVIVSHLLPYELVINLISRSQDEKILHTLNCFLVEKQSFIIIDVTKGVLEKSITLMEKHGLKSYDAIQLACALEAKKTYKELIFICNDDKLKKAAQAENLDVNIT